MLDQLRHPVNLKHHAHGDLGARLADRIAAFLGSWRFLIMQTVVVAGWMTGNVLLLLHFDPAPFILLNLAFSTQAAYTGPVLLLAGNRQAAKDRDMAEHDYAVNQAALEHLKELVAGNRRVLEVLAEAELRLISRAK